MCKTVSLPGQVELIYRKHENRTSQPSRFVDCAGCVVRVGQLRFSERISGPRFNASADSASFLIVIVFCWLCDGVLPNQVSGARP